VQAAGSIVPKLLRDLGLEKNLQGWQAVREWPEVVGPRIARRAHAVAFRDGVLRVEVEGSAWQYELGFLERRLIQEIERRLGAPCVRKLQFVQARGGIRR
jgi:predicted nucleic acid-binding Zn ribbon protein